MYVLFFTHLKVVTKAPLLSICTLHYQVLLVFFYGNFFPQFFLIHHEPSILTCAKQFCSEVIILSTVGKDTFTNPQKMSMFLMSMTRTPSYTFSVSVKSFLPGEACRAILPMCGSFL